MIDHAILINGNTKVCRYDKDQAIKCFEYYCTHNDQDDIKLIQVNFNKRTGDTINETLLKHRPIIGVIEI